jgi:hypothetical protein
MFDFKKINIYDKGIILIYVIYILILKNIKNNNKTFCSKNVNGTPTRGTERHFSPDSSLELSYLTRR